MPFEINILIYSNHLTKEKSAGMNVELCSLEEIFKRADVVSLHSPASEKNRGLITGEHIALMKPYASLINTARGSIVREKELVEVLRQRPDLVAVLDVTDPEPPAPGSEIFELPNIITTPHIAGSMNRECQRMGKFMVEELKRYLSGEPLKWELTCEQVGYLA